MQTLRTEVRNDMLALQICAQLICFPAALGLSVHLGLLIGAAISWLNFLSLFAAAAQVTQMTAEAAKIYSLKSAVSRLAKLAVLTGLALWSGVANPFALLLALFSAQIAVGVGVLRVRFRGVSA